jgi:hypothetical protein
MLCVFIFNILQENQVTFDGSLGLPFFPRDKHCESRLELAPDNRMVSETLF